jgi:hypothetical protein
MRDFAFLSKHNCVAASIKIDAAVHRAIDSGMQIVDI